MFLKNFKLLFGFFVHLYFIVSFAENIGQLPHCVENINQGLILISTLDGKLSALNTSGSLIWDVATDPGALLKSNIHNIELTNNGEWIRLIPSLTGSIYKFNGEKIDAIPINADNLLKSSQLYSSELVIAGGKELRTYGIGLHTGHILYTCSITGCQNKTQYEDEIDDVIIIERNTYVIRAHEPRTGSERWNFSVGQHSIRIPNHGCSNPQANFNFKINTVLPDGLIKAYNENEMLWKFKFESPIVNVWLWDGRNLQNVDVFDQGTIIQNDVELNPAIYLAMHNKQLYIHESEKMLKMLQREFDTNEMQRNNVRSIPWKPVIASERIPNSITDNSQDIKKSTAVSVLYNSEYVNGNGFYLYTDTDVNMDIEEELKDAGNIDKGILMYLPWCWHWTVYLTIVIAILAYLLICNDDIKVWISIKSSRKSESNQNATVLPCSLENPGKSEENLQFLSHYENSFETIGCLGKGGFGVVFKVKQKIDQCEYAIKRITLRKEDSQHVLREVRALATLDHRNIVRYYNSWFENPPHGYQYEYDKDIILDSNSYVASSPIKSHRRNNSTIIDLSEISISEMNVTESSGGIVFQNETETNDANSNSISFRNNKTCTYSRASSIKGSNKISTATTNVKELTTTDETPVYLYIQMQLCREESLKEWLFVNNKHRERSSVISIFKQIVDAVDYVHSKGFIHRDLKPNNIFFSIEGDIKIGDFGLVTTMYEHFDSNSNVGGSLRYNHTRNVGTRLYMSPEQIARKKYTYKVDIYSLGVILFELLVPFSTESERIHTLTNLREGKYPERFAEEYQVEFILLERMLSQNPNNRPDTAEIKATPLFY